MTGSFETTVSAAPAPPQEPNRQRAPRRRWWHWLRGLALVIVLAVMALLVGVLIAWIVHLIRGNPPARTAAPGPAASVSTAASPAASPAAAPKVTSAVVPVAWITEISPPVGLRYRHPPGWVRRTANPEVLRLAPAAPDSTAPGIEGVGAGIEPAADPAQAVKAFAIRTYGGEPGFVVTTAAPVTAGERAAHPGEQQAIVTYDRSGVVVRVAIHSFRSRTKTVLAIGRSANAQPARAEQLVASVEASLIIA